MKLLILMTVFRRTLALLERPPHSFHSGGCRGTVGPRSRGGKNYKVVQKNKVESGFSVTSSPAGAAGFF